METTNKLYTVEQAKARLAAAEKRIRAAATRSYAASYTQQSTRPIYLGQESICTAKAATAMAIADRLEAEADLMLAEAGL